VGWARRYELQGANPTEGPSILGLAGTRGAIATAWADLDADGIVGVVAVQGGTGTEPGVAGHFSRPPGAATELSSADSLFLPEEQRGLEPLVIAANLDGDEYDDVVVSARAAHRGGAVYLLLGGGLSDGDGITVAEGDCDDARADVGPGGDEAVACEDGRDNDCDGLVDGQDDACAVLGSGFVFACSTPGGGSAASLLGTAPLFALLLRRGRGLGLALLSACSGEGVVLPPAAITITHPIDGQPVVGLAVPVAVTVEGRRLAPEHEGSADAAPDEVLWRLYVDGVDMGRSGGPVQIVDVLEFRSHRAEAELLSAATLEPVPDVPRSEVEFQLVGGTPEVRVLNPQPDAIVSPELFEVHYEVDSFILSPEGIGGENQPGSGHVQVFVDDTLFDTDTSGVAEVAGAPPGARTLRVLLANNDGTPVGGGAEVALPVLVQSASVQIIDPTEGSTVTGPGVVARYDVSAFTLSDQIGGQPVQGEGHVHIYLDGVYSGLNFSGEITLDEVNGCDHTLRLKLALADHTELAAEGLVAFSYRPCVAIGAPAEDDQLAGPLVTVQYESLGFELDPGEVSGVPTGRHVHIYLDGTFIDTDTSGAAMDLPVSGAGPHELEIRLANPGHVVGLETSDEVVPEVSAVVGFELLP
jgi:hypothetical protein